MKTDFSTESVSGDPRGVRRERRVAGGAARLALFCWLFIAPFFAAPCAAQGGSLRIENQGDVEIINILASTPNRGFFLRLDLAPLDSDEVENPDVTADLRVDCGIFFLHFEKVPLQEAVALVFGADYPDTLTLDKADGQSIRLRGRLEELVPPHGSRPVCHLSSFRPGMTMEDVCSITPADAPRDDNGAVMTGLGFADMVWAARLYPGKDGMLEHLELRRPLEFADLKRLVEFLWRRNYAPWQAEFPGLDIDFADMPQKDPAAQQGWLDAALDDFLKERRGEATVMFAPTGSLPALADADAPKSDVQLFTLVLRPKSNLLLLDVAAYRGREPDEPSAP